MLDQMTILNKLKTYTEKYNINLEKNINFNKGFCSGFSVIWLYAMWLSFQEKGDGDKKRDDIDWFDESLKTIDTWDETSTLDEKDQNIFNYFLQHLIFFQKISNYLKTNLWELAQYVEDTKGRKLSQEFSTIAGLFTGKNLENLLEKILIHENRLIYISTHKHAMAIFKHKNTYYFYDPNYDEGHAEVNSVKELSEAIFEANGFNNNKQSPIGINIFTFEEPKKDYLKLSSLIKYITTNRYNSDYCDGITSLHMACGSGNLEIVKWLRERGADVNQDNKKGKTPLYIACGCGHLDIVKYLIDHNAEVNQANNNGKTPLYIACKYGHLDIVKWLSENGADVNQANNDDKTPLYIACEYGHLDIIKWLRENDANANHADNNALVALLYIACKYGHLDIVKWLSENNVDVNQTDNDGKTPLYIACEYGHLDIIKWLRENGANVNHADNNALVGLLYIACKYGHLDIVKWLSENNVDVNQTDNYGRTPLYIACEDGYLDIVKYLIENGADITQDSLIKYIVCARSHSDIIKYLTDKLIKNNDDYKTFLSKIPENKRSIIIDLLLLQELTYFKKQMNVQIKVPNGKTLTIDTTLMTTILNLKKAILGELKKNINDPTKTTLQIENLQLIFSGKQLEDVEDDKTLAHYNISKDITIHLVFRNLPTPNVIKKNLALFSYFKEQQMNVKIKVEGLNGVHIPNYTRTPIPTLTGQ